MAGAMLGLATGNSIVGIVTSAIAPALIADAGWSKAEYALIGSLSGRSSFGTLALLTLFLAGFITLILARKPLEQLEQRKEAEA